MRIGIICPSEIAFRRFMPAVLKVEEIEYIGVAYATLSEWYGKDIKIQEGMEKVIESEREKAENFRNTYGGKVFEGYEAMLKSGEIDAVYIPLPPALHYAWAKLALDCGLHVFVEKPSTTRLADTEDLILVASQKGLALHENYMFAYHTQLETVKRVIEDGIIGKVRLFRIDFGFPKRPMGDFRYNKKLGGGALLDCGGYTLKYADMLLGGNAKIEAATVMNDEDFEVEIFGTAVLSDDSKKTVQVAFGMDNDYRCSINVWGSKGTLISNRILTAPEGFAPTYSIFVNGKEEVYTMEADDTFYKSIMHFVKCVKDEKVRTGNYEALRRQEQLVDEFMKKAGM